MPLREAMETQRAIRRLKPDPVDEDIILRCIRVALKAPTGSNAQNWHWIVVRDPVVRARLGRLMRQSWRIYGGLGRIVAGNDEQMRRVIDAVQWQADHFEEIPVLDLPRDPELPPGLSGRGSGGGAHHLAALVDDVGPPRTGPPF
jgi:nitroreductase